MSPLELKEKLTGQLGTYVQDDIEVIEANNSESNMPTVVPTFEITFAEAQQRIALLQKFVKEMMIPGQDYGVIPRCDKPTLFKPGAEKLCDIYGFSKRIEVINRVEDWQGGLFHYEVKATLISKRTGLIEAEGIGSCNNREKKYATQDPYSVVNTILKMSKKRAFIDAVLSATRSSGLFSQDLEDLEDTDKAAAPATKKTPAENVMPTKPDTDTRPVTQPQLAKIQSLVSNKGIPVGVVRAGLIERYRVPDARSLTLRQADDFIKFLISYKAAG